MTSPLPKFTVFDHDSGTLQVFSEKVGFTKLVTTKTGDAKDEEAKKLLLADTNWRVALVHIHNGPWISLCEKTPTDNVIIRFSTQGYPPIPPVADKKSLCLHCCQKIENVTEEDITILKTVFSDTRTHESLRQGIIPESIRHLIYFVDPHTLRDLRILMMGVLASWASVPGHTYSGQAHRCLGVSAIPPLPDQAIEKRLTIWKALGLSSSNGIEAENVDTFRKRVAIELSMRIDTDNLLTSNSAIDNLLDTICKDAADESLDADTVIKGFEELNKVLSV